MTVRHSVLHHDPDRFCGWPANNGAWQWGDEFLVRFSYHDYDEAGEYHHFDRDGRDEARFARSADGGESWSVTAADDGFDGEVRPVGDALEFDHPDFAMRVRRDRFVVSFDRGHSWEGPHPLPDFGLDADLTARTDYQVTADGDCLAFLSVDEPQVEAGMTDRAFCARTSDGRDWTVEGWMTGDPVEVRSVMPATVRLSDGSLVAAMRRRHWKHNWIDVYRSTDDGASWSFLSKVADTDVVQESNNGNPPAMVALDDDRLVVVYGYRATPYGLRAVVSDDGGRTWGAPRRLREDGARSDLGYPRLLERSDGGLVAVYYYTTAERPEQHVAATRFSPRA
jgi:hypothetical protein